jgi:hypothetical protein
MYAELKLHSLTSPTLHPLSLRNGITSDITDIASTDITATCIDTTPLLYHQQYLDITDASDIAAFDIPLTPDITGKRLWHPIANTYCAAMGQYPSSLLATSRRSLSL